MAKKPTKPIRQAIQVKNPIQEAILQIKFTQDNWDITSAGRLYDRLVKTYPERRDVQSVAFVVGTPRAVLPPPQAPVMQLWTADRSRLVQFGPGIVAANCFKYSDWSVFLDGLKDVAEAYIDVVEPSMATQASARYINKFDFKSTQVDLDKNFTCGIGLPDGMDDIDSFHLNLVSRPKADSNRLYTNIVNFGADPAKSDAKNTVLLLDIESFMGMSAKPSFAQIKDTMDTLHLAIKQLFIGFLQPELRAQYGSEAK